MQNDSVHTEANLFYCAVFPFLLQWNSYLRSCPAVWTSGISGYHGRCVDVHYMAPVVIDTAGLLIIAPIPNFISFGLVDTNALIRSAAGGKGIQTLLPDMQMALW
jgi:hypothetical protein